MGFSPPASFRLTSLLALAALVIVGCVDEEATEPTDTTDDHLFANTTVLWPHPASIPVCWVNPTDQAAMGWVEDAVAKTWSAHSPVRFVGWRACPASTAAAMVRIRIYDDNPQSITGADTGGRAVTTWLNFAFRRWNPSCQQTRESCIRVGAVHEFGHALGFDHEQNRPDTQGRCRRDTVGSTGNRPLGAWDPSSVMNYCAAVAVNQLSAGDVAGLQAVYGTPRNPKPIDVATRPSLFDVNDYLALNPDLGKAFGTNIAGATEHWVNHGRREGRAASVAFGVRSYMTRYEDLTRAFGNNWIAAEDHWVSYGTGEGRAGSVVFDPRYYLDTHPAVARAVGPQNYPGALRHFLVDGITAGFRGSAQFDSVYYLQAYPEIAAACGGAAKYRCAMLHYLVYGLAQGRQGANATKGS